MSARQCFEITQILAMGMHHNCEHKWAYCGWSTMTMTSTCGIEPQPEVNPKDDLEIILERPGQLAPRSSLCFTGMW